MKIKNMLIIGLIMIVCISAISYAAYNPAGAVDATINGYDNFNNTNYPGYNVKAYAGNVTNLTIKGVSQTKTWQGYFGEVTGEITLQDASNHTMYDWQETEPQGQIYAANSSAITWANVDCFEFASTTEVNTSIVEKHFNMDSFDADGIDETFTDNSNTGFYIGEKQIAVNTCPATNTYVNSASQSSDFEEVMLSDNSNILFMTFLENDESGQQADVTGFDGNTHDFQLLVPEDGHNADTTHSDYYFYVEIV